MLTKESLEEQFRSHPLISPRLDTLRLAEELNPRFHNPHIVGGYLRNIALGAKPNDCDVVFQEYMLNQPGTLECVQEAEARLGVEPCPEWEFENTTATGPSGDFYEDNIGQHSYHTDYLTMLMMDSRGQLLIGGQRVLDHLDQRIYDLHFPGIAVWANHRGGGRSYASCLIGDLMRGLYLSQSLDLTPSERAAYLMMKFDEIFQTLNPQDQAARQVYWEKKTKRDPFYQPILDRHGVTSLTMK